MQLAEDLQRVLQPNAKVYCTMTQRQGKVTDVNVINDEVVINYGTSKVPDVTSYSVDDFKEYLTTDKIVSYSRVGLGRGDSYVIKPRTVTSSVEPPKEPELITQAPPKASPTPVDAGPLEVGYLNVKTGRFRTDPKEGYTRIEYREVSTEAVTLEVTEEQKKVLRDMGLLK